MVWTDLIWHQWQNRFHAWLTQNWYINSVTINLKIQKNSLFQEDFRGSFAVETEVAIWKLNYSAHGLTDRIKGVDLVELILWNLFTNRCIVSLQVQHKAQQATLSLIPHLLGQATFHIRRLEKIRREEKKFFVQTEVFLILFNCVPAFFGYGHSPEFVYWLQLPAGYLFCW